MTNNNLNNYQTFDTLTDATEARDEITRTDGLKLKIERSVIRGEGYILAIYVAGEFVQYI